MTALLSCFLLLSTTSMARALHVVRSPGAKEGPLCVFVHGLDSYSGTWKQTMANLNVPCLAVDQRGCGASPDLNDDTFTQDALVDDLFQVIDKETRPGDSVVLVGHSLGGRIALGYAAKYPEKLAAVVVEDMDIVPRLASPIPIPEFKSYFSRDASCKEDMTAAICSYNYPEERVEDWWREGRITVNSDGTVRSNLNPDFRRLCYKHVLSTENGRRDCHTIASLSPQLPCHLMVAGTEGTVCFEDSIDEMKNILGSQLKVHRYPEAEHSIHGSEKKAFLEAMEEIIQKIAPSLKPRGRL